MTWSVMTVVITRNFQFKKRVIKDSSLKFLHMEDITVLVPSRRQKKKKKAKKFHIIFHHKAIPHLWGFFPTIERKKWVESSPDPAKSIQYKHTFYNPGTYQYKEDKDILPFRSRRGHSWTVHSNSLLSTKSKFWNKKNKYFCIWFALDYWLSMTSQPIGCTLVVSLLNCTVTATKDGLSG